MGTVKKGLMRSWHEEGAFMVFQISQAARVIDIPIRPSHLDLGSSVEFTRDAQEDASLSLSQFNVTISLNFMLPNTG